MPSPESTGKLDSGRREPTQGPAETISYLGEEEEPPVTLCVLQNVNLFADVQRAQMADETCQADVATLRRVEAEGPRTEEERRAGEEYTLRDGYIFRRKEEHVGLFVPPEMEARVLNEFHDSDLAGHPGQEATLEAITRTYYWPEVERSVREHVESCITCAGAKRGGALQPDAPLRPRAPTHPWHTVSIDILGPYGRTPNTEKYALAMVDTFTKWVEVQVIKRANTKPVLEALHEHFSRFGFPAVIITDHGVPFKGGKWERYLRQNRIRHELSPVWHQQANPVERRIQEVKKILRTTVSAHPDLWVQHLPAALFALRTRPNAATGTTPSTLLFGENLKRPGEWQVPANCYPPVQPREERVAQARENQVNYQRQRYPEPREPPVVFQRGDLVMARDRRSTKGNFARPWSGPHRVLRVLGSGRYLVERDERELNAHINDLRPAPPPTI